MKNKTTRLLLAAAAIAVGTAAALVGTSPADAGSNRYKDRIYADSFGNLIVHSRAGYKRIVVGAGYLAEELAAYESGESSEPDVVYLDEREKRHHGRKCGGPVLLKGRSYMYGLPDGYLPQPACDGVLY